MFTFLYNATNCFFSLGVKGLASNVFQFLTMLFLADVLDKTLTSVILIMFQKAQNIMLKMHLSNVFSKE